jgi:hypothetical protein
MPDYSIVLTRQCAFCSTTFTYWHSRRSNPPRRYCSEQCRRDGIARARATDFPCQHCSKPIQLDKKRTNVKHVVCSAACMAALLLAARRERLLARVDQSGDCWIWLGHVSPTTGYGTARFEGRNTSAHRVAYTLLVGPIPPGLEIDHLCHSRDQMCPGDITCPHRRCIKPSHLELVTRQVNTLRRYRRIVMA